MTGSVGVGFGYPLVFGTGAAVAALGMLAFSRVPVEDGLGLTIVSSVFIGAGIAPMMTLATDVVVGSAPPNRSGAAAALSETAAELGAPLGIAVMGSIGTALYRSRILDGLPGGIPGEATEVVSSSLGAAMGVAEHLPPDVATLMTDLVQHAFVDGLSSAALTGGVILAAAAIVCPYLLRRGRAVCSDSDPTGSA